MASESEVLEAELPARVGHLPRRAFRHEGAHAMLAAHLAAVVW